jgi:hypothetical protein
VPKHTAAGEYLSGISVEVAHQHATRKVGSNVAISSVIRYAIGLEVRVPGPLRPRIVLTGARLERRPAGLTFLLDASNPGNKILKRVTGTIVVTRPGGIAAHAVIGPGTFVSGTSIEYPVPAIGEVPVQGTVYSLHARMRYGRQVVRLDRQLVFGARLATVQHQFGGPPPQSASTGGGVPVAVVIGIVAGMLLAFGLVLVVLWRRQRVRRADS